jgi:hypothetical protein
MRARGFTQEDALHQLAFVLEDVTWQAKTKGQNVDMQQYIEKAKAYTQSVLCQPKLARSSRAKLRTLRLES